MDEREGSDDLTAATGARRRWAGVAAGTLIIAGGLGGVAIWAGRDDGPNRTTDYPAAKASYDGPLSAPGTYGAAGRAIECVHPPQGENRTEAVYSQGATSDSPRKAVDTAYSEGLFLSLPRLDLAVAATERDRQLLTYAPAGRTLAAIVLHRGPAAEGTGGAGWYLETFARCDFAEFPEADRDLGLVNYGVWSDKNGVPVPVTKVYSSPGPEHCSWESMTFLNVDDGASASRSYVEDPIDELKEFVAGPYRAGIALPADARATGWRRDGRELWLAPDGRYAYVGDEQSVAAWPRFESGCA